MPSAPDQVTAGAGAATHERQHGRRQGQEEEAVVEEGLQGPGQVARQAARRRGLRPRRDDAQRRDGQADARRRAARAGRRQPRRGAARRPRALVRGGPARGPRRGDPARRAARRGLAARGAAAAAPRRRRRAPARAAPRGRARARARSRSPAPPPAYDAVARPPRAARDAPPPPPAAAFGAAAPLFTHFSETCGAPLTAEGADAAAARGHEVVELEKAYRSRLDALRQLLVAKLLPRRDRLAAAARWVRDRAEAFDRAFDRLDAEARRDADALLGRLRDAHQARSAELGRAAEQLAQDVADVDRLALEASNAEADAAAEKAPASKVGFVHRFAELCHEVEEVAGLELPRLPDADPDAALPRELQERLAALANAEGWREALDVKDEMLWELADRLAAADAALAKEKALTEDYAGEVAHWVDLAKDLRGQLDAARARADAAGDERRRLRALEREAELRADELAAARAEAGDLREEPPAPARRRRGRGRRRRRLGPPPPARSNPATLSPAAGACLERRDERVAQPLGRLAPAGQTRRGHRLSIIILAVETRRGGFLDAPRDVTTCTFFFRRRLRFLC